MDFVKDWSNHLPENVERIKDALKDATRQPIKNVFQNRKQATEFQWGAPKYPLKNVVALIATCSPGEKHRAKLVALPEKDAYALFDETTQLYFSSFTHWNNLLQRTYVNPQAGSGHCWSPYSPPVVIEFLFPDGHKIPLTKMRHVIFKTEPKTGAKRKRTVATEPVIPKTLTEKFYAIFQKPISEKQFNVSHEKLLEVHAEINQLRVEIDDGRKGDSAKEHGYKKIKTDLSIIFKALFPAKMIPVASGRKKNKTRRFGMLFQFDHVEENKNENMMHCATQAANVQDQRYEHISGKVWQPRKDLSVQQSRTYRSVQNAIHCANLCLCCNKMVSPWNDAHVCARSEGGSDAPFNLVRICGICNNTMGEKNLFEYLYLSNIPIFFTEKLLDTIKAMYFSRIVQQNDAWGLLLENQKISQLPTVPEKLIDFLNTFVLSVKCGGKVVQGGVESAQVMQALYRLVRGEHLKDLSEDQKTVLKDFEKEMVHGNEEAQGFTQSMYLITEKRQERHQLFSQCLISPEVCPEVVSEKEKGQKDFEKGQKDFEKGLSLPVKDPYDFENQEYIFLAKKFFDRAMLNNRWAQWGNVQNGCLLSSDVIESRWEIFFANETGEPVNFQMKLLLRNILLLSSFKWKMVQLQKDNYRFVKNYF
jgi:5-methylcytosine-specific restriction endonuclease McrA